jgi:hypothetical protein
MATKKIEPTNPDKTTTKAGDAITEEQRVTGRKSSRKVHRKVLKKQA